MGEDTTQDMSQQYDTKPTIDTLLERVNFLIEQMAAFRAEVDIRFDRLEGFANKTHSDLLYFRADFKEFRSQFKEPA